MGFGGIFYDSTESKIAEFGDSLFEKNVGWLDIAVDDFALQEGVISANQMTHEGERFSLAYAIVFTVLIQVRLQVAILAVLQHYVEMLSASETVVHLDDVRGRQ